VYRVEPILIPATDTRRALRTARVVLLPDATTRATIASLLADVGVTASAYPSSKADSALELAFDLLGDGREHQRAEMLTHAKERGVAERTFRRALEELVQRGIVAAERRDFPATAYYRLAVGPPPDDPASGSPRDRETGPTDRDDVPGRIPGLDDVFAAPVGSSYLALGPTGPTETEEGQETQRGHEAAD
jgi:hypothetical protein